MTTPTDIQVDQARNALTQDYYNSVRNIANEADNEIRNGNLTDRDEFDTWLHQTCDGNYWTIYTHANLQVMQASRNWLEADDEYIEMPEAGLSTLLSQYAYFALRADVLEHMELDGYDDETYKTAATEEDGE